MSLIEQAALRLEALRNAGVDVGDRKLPEEAIPPNAVEPQALALEAAAESETSHSPAAGEVPVIPSVHRTRSSIARRGRTVEIDLDALKLAGYVTPDASTSHIAEEFRVIKRPIIRNTQSKGGAVAAGHRSNLVMVTSALPEEGKSFVALNLALSIASEVDSTVLLVDADVAKPNLLKTMRLASSKGLLDVLTGEVKDVSEVMLRTNIPKLSILPAGTPQPRATEMLASEAMARLVSEMAARYTDRIIVFDSPPLLVTTEARVLAALMGQILLVVEADGTTQSAVAHALETIDSCPIVLTLLNKAIRSDVGGYAYGGYGGYGARGYGGSGT
jgi:receptor protein-tyrosine kinase